MWLAVHLACILLKLPLSMRQRTKLTGAILEANNAVPLADIISHSSTGELLIGGEPVGLEKAIQLRESADAMLSNEAMKHVREQVASLAGRRGVVEGDTPEKLYFYRAALWWGLQEQQFLEKLSGKQRYCSIMQ